MLERHVTYTMPCSITDSLPYEDKSELDEDAEYERFRQEEIDVRIAPSGG